MTYPNGRVLTYNYGAAGSMDNAISRLESISDSTGTLESYTYLGDGTLIQVAHPNVAGGGLTLTYGSNGNYSGLDNFGRVVCQDWILSSSLDGSSIKAVYFVQDANFNVTTLVDGATGTVLLRKVYTPYGAQTLLNGDWTPADNSTLSTTIHSTFGASLSTGVVNAVINTLTNGPGFQGLARDGESGLIYSRARYTNP
ncbi:MAG: hypothetical protein WCI73_13135, partial [Phycisphaerae bacterium]